MSRPTNASLDSAAVSSDELFALWTSFDALAPAPTPSVDLFGVGALKTIITSRSWLRSGLESMMTGIIAAAVTYGAGRLLGAR